MYDKLCLTLSLVSSPMGERREGDERMTVVVQQNVMHDSLSVLRSSY